MPTPNKERTIWSLHRTDLPPISWLDKILIPTIQTKRLILSPFTFDDGPRVEELAGNESVARTTLNIPHPYPENTAIHWIASHQLSYLKGGGVTFSIRLKDGLLIGCVSLGVNKSHERGELGYWLGNQYWNLGYTTEAAKACIEFGFNTMKLCRITSCHILSNPASGKVMEKIGMKKEGVFRCHIQKNGVFHDIINYGILKEELP